MFKLSKGSYLFSEHTFRKLCEFQTDLESSALYEPTCEPWCDCHSFSLVNYITYLSEGPQACHDVTADQLRNVSQLLLHCHSSYTASSPDCWGSGASPRLRSCGIPEECADSTIYELYHYILDSKAFDAEHEVLTMTFIHMAEGKGAYSYYRDLMKRVSWREGSNGVELFALDFGLKNYVFEDYLLMDSCWIGLALAVVFLVMWMYTESMFLSTISLVSMLFTIIISFFLYQFVFRITYFPFMNLLAAVVVIGTGADDLFIFWKTWTAIKHSRNASILERLVTHTLSHASAAMFVTSASTATAFFASSYTDIVSIKCFCIYAGTCILVHYLLILTWLPACVVLYEKYALVACCSSAKTSQPCRFLASLHSRVTSLVTSMLNKLAVASVCSVVWLPLFLAVAIGGALAIFLWPGFSSPSADMFQMLRARHPFEVYDRLVKHQFAFERSGESVHHLPLIFVFGVDSTFTGSYFDLSSTGDLHLQPLPDLSSTQMQLWFSGFCYDLRQQLFMHPSMSQPFGCFIEEMRTWLKLRSCSVDPICCKKLQFPYNATSFSHCLTRWSIDRTASGASAIDSGVRYMASQPAAVIISFWSSQQFTYSYSTMETFYSNVTQFLQSQLATCTFDGCDRLQPFVTTSGGWSFYDVQMTVISSLPLCLLIVLAASSLIIFLTTLNVLLTVCSLISISCSILTVLGLLALMGWELNILESVIVSLSIGLSMDYSLHIAVAYRSAFSTQNRKSRVTVSLRHVGGSILAAAITSAIAGICLLPAHIIAYQRLAVFLALVSIISWLTAFFLLPSLLVLIGPKGTYSQLVCCLRRKHAVTRQLDKTIYSDEISSEMITNSAAQTQLSHLHSELPRDDSDNIELATATTGLLESSPVPPNSLHRLSTIEETTPIDDDPYPRSFTNQ